MSGRICTKPKWMAIFGGKGSSIHKVWISDHRNVLLFGLDVFCLPFQINSLPCPRCLVLGEADYANGKPCILVSGAHWQRGRRSRTRHVFPSHDAPLPLVLSGGPPYPYLQLALWLGLWIFSPYSPVGCYQTLGGLPHLSCATISLHPTHSLTNSNFTKLSQVSQYKCITRLFSFCRYCE